MDERTLFFIIFIFYIILLFLYLSLYISYQFDSSEFNNLLLNWKKQPIIDFSQTFTEEGYDKNDYIEINRTKIYVKRMNKTFNFPYLKVRQNKDDYDKNCGTDTFYNSIYFKFDEECPINFINYSLTNICDEQKWSGKCLQITPSYFLIYSNDTSDDYYYYDYYDYYNNYDYYDDYGHYSPKIVIDINTTDPKKLTIISYNIEQNDIFYDLESYYYNSDDFENFFIYISRIKKK